MTSLEALARESFARGVKSVAGNLAAATDVHAFVDALAELLELSTDAGALVCRMGDDTLAVRLGNGTYQLGVAAREPSLVPWRS